MQMFILVASIVATLGAAAALAAEADNAKVANTGETSFNRELAPVIFGHCAPCHRPGGTGPFALLHYAEARKRAKEMAEVTAKRIMPPWLPAPGHGEFIDARRLSDAEVELFQRWLAGGAREGNADDLPPAPVFPADWQLGPPDLVVWMSEPYELGPEGSDVYRNFVVPLPLASNRFVQAFEFRPGNQSVHHVRILFDRTGQCRRLNEQDPETGFSGMNVPARFPPGQLLSWAPGRQPRRNPPELTWLVEAGSDLVLQMHMQRTGKRESVQPVIGFYFTDVPPTKTPFVMGMVSQLIDIPAGATNYTVTRSLELPSDVELLAVMPHAHYLAREVRFNAALPDGKSLSLLWIPHWDFNWQEVYHYREPVHLPRGARLELSIGYDNSADNVRNPNHPPRRVVFGPQSTDEMGEIWLQVFPGNANDLAVLKREKQLMDSRETAAFYENFLRAHPDDAPAHVGLGKVLGPLGQTASAAQHFRTAVELNPRQPEAHYYLGLIFFDQQKFTEARAEYENELRVNPDYYKAQVGLGMISIEEQNLEQAEMHLRAALRINPKDPGVQEILARIVKARTSAKP
jgi:Tfp pilus assembly protein PilF/mono/diheme cytochrome c family protein